MRRAWIVALAGALVTAVVAPCARADDACLNAPVEGQKLQRAGKLLLARNVFASCARKSCPSEIVQDCTRWVEEVGAALPSVALAARDQDGKDLLDVTVSIDGSSPVAVSARATDVDPGPHHFVFRRAGAADVTVERLLREGEKAREVVATFGAPKAALPVVPPPAPQPTETSRPIPAGAWILGGVGVLAIASFATFGALGVSQRSSDGCDTGCPASQKDTVDTELRVADVSLGVAVVALGAAAWIFFTRKEVERPASSASIGLVHRPGGGLATFGARF